MFFQWFCLDFKYIFSKVSKQLSHKKKRTGLLRLGYEQFKQHTQNLLPVRLAAHGEKEKVEKKKGNCTDFYVNANVKNTIILPEAFLFY